MKEKQMRTNNLYVQANNYRKKMTDENDIEKNDCTELLEHEENYMIEHDEILLEQVNGKMRMGKSTVALARAYRIYKRLQELGYQPKDKPFSMENIARDEQEFSKRMRNPTLKRTIIVTDESNELEQTGENVTSERALRKVFSDVHAGRYVHHIDCAPKDVIDPNTDIILTVIAINKETKTTRAKLHYRYNEGGIEYTQLLGYVDTYVGDILEKDWYKLYMKRKYEKMDLITKEGIFKPRVLDYAELILKVIEELKDLTKLGSLVDRNLVRNYVKQYATEQKIPMSIIGEELASREALGVLDVYKSYWKNQGVLNKLRKKDETEEILEQLKEGERIRDKLRESIRVQETTLQRYKEINKKYHSET